MKIFYPALVTSAIFFGAIVVNLHEQYYGTVLFISLLAIPAVLLQVLLTQKGLDILGYTLILVPIIIVYIGYSLGIQKKEVIYVEDKKQMPNKNKVPERFESQMT
jgi:energy-converting hydrogenase Eha subunit C